MATVEDTWQPARLFPITSIGGPDEQERRGCSALLAVLRSVREFGRTLTMRCGAPAGTIEPFIEVPFVLNDSKFRPDGLIRVSRGKTTWTALVEVKTGTNDLKTDQVTSYVDIARDQGFDAVITISHQVATTPGIHPISVSRLKLKKVSLSHLSWSRIHTEALIERTNQTVTDPDQAWILSEFIRYIENPKSGALDFDDMGPSWVAVRDSSVRQTAKASDATTLDVVAKFDQLLAYAGMELSRRLGVNVQQRLSKKELADHAVRIQTQALRLADTGQLSGSLFVPNSATPIEVSADLRAGRIACSAVIQASTHDRPQTRVNWILRQLKDAPGDLLVTATPAFARDGGPCHPLSIASESPKLLVQSPQSDIRSFTLTLGRKAGTKRGKTKGSFVESVTSLVDDFYVDVVRHLKNWSPPAPLPQKALQDSAQEVEPPTTPDGRTALRSTADNQVAPEAPLDDEAAQAVARGGASGRWLEGDRS